MLGSFILARENKYENFHIHIYMYLILTKGSLNT